MGFFLFVLFPSHKTLKIYMLFVTTTTLWEATTYSVMTSLLFVSFVYFCFCVITLHISCTVVQAVFRKWGEKSCMKRQLYSDPVFRKTFVTATDTISILFYHNKRCNISIKKKNLVCLAGRMVRGKSWKERNTLKGFEHSKASSRVYQGQK